MLCVARTLKDMVGVPLAVIRQILRLALGSMLQLVEKYIEHITYYYYSHFYSCTACRKICPIKGTFYGSQRTRKTQTCGARIL